MQTHISSNTNAVTVDTIKPGALPRYESYPSTRTVTSGDTSNPPRVDVGELRYDFQTAGTVIWDGAMWQSVPQTFVNIDFNPEYETALKWAVNKMHEETANKQLEEDNDDLRAAKQLYDKILEDIKITKKLIKEDK